MNGENHIVKKFLITNMDLCAEDNGKIYSVLPTTEKRYVTISRLYDNWEEYDRITFYIIDLKRRFLPVLSKELNEYHGLEWKDEQWDVVCGTWLYSRLFVVYDRFKRMEKIPLNEYYTYAKEGDFEAYGRPDGPEDHFYNAFNSYLLKEISLYLGLEVQYKTGKNTDSEKRENPKIKLAKRVIKRLGHGDISLKYVINKVIQSKKYSVPDSEIVLIRSFLPKNVMVDLERSGLVRDLQLEYVSGAYEIKKIKHQKEYHKLSLEDFDAKNKFEVFCKYILPQIFPEKILYDFPEIYKKVVRATTHSQVRYVYSSASVGVNLIPSVYGAVLRGKGAKLIDIQHSATYNALYTQYISETLIFDEFLTWGMKYDNSFGLDNVRPCGINRVPTNIGEYVQKGQSQILCVSNMDFITEGGEGINASNYLDNHFRFLNSLSEEYLNRLLVRLRCKRGDLMDLIYKRSYEKVKTELKSDRSFAESALESQIIVCDTLGSTHVEGMIIGVPVMFFEASDFHKSAGCKEALEELRKHKIYASSPEEAALNLQSIDDIWAWWTSPDVEKAVHDYLDVFAHGYEDVYACWKKEFEKHINK